MTSFPRVDPAAPCTTGDPEVATRRVAQALDLTNAGEAFRRRFWSKVNRRGPDDCWPWLAYCSRSGYGQFTIRDGVFMTASRVALALTIGRPLEAGELGCHHCDNPPCVNPSHLFAGSFVDNALDSVQKGRARRARGEDTASAKLTEELVREIRRQFTQGGTNKGLARIYGVSSTTIRSIRRGSKWGHVA